MNAHATPHVLVVEDDAQTADEIVAALHDEGWTATHVHDGVTAVLTLRDRAFDAVVLDRMLPGSIDGLGALSSLRRGGIDVPVLILSALSDVEERVRGIRAGGDDYLVKPFNAIELTARIAALLRRRWAPERETELAVGDLHLDLINRLVSRAGQAIPLQPREFQLLEYMARNAGRAVTRAMIFEQVWGYRYDDRTNVINVHMTKLRRKLEIDGLPPLIHTLRGEGYVLRPA